MLLYVWDIPQLCSYYILHMHTVDGENPAPVNNSITLGSYETVHNP